MQNGLLKISLLDVVRGAITAVCAAILIALAGIATQPGFDVFAVDWASTGRLIVNTSIPAFFGYVMKNALTTNDGKFLGTI